MKTRVLELDDKKVIINVINWRLIVINPISSTYEIRNDSNDIVSLNFGEYEIHVNKQFKLDRNEYKIHHIKKKLEREPGAEFGAGYYCYCYVPIRNITNWFILPVIGYDKTKFRLDKEFCCSFVGLEGDGDYGDNLYVLYRYTGSFEFLQFDNIVSKLPNYEETINIDNYHVMYKFSIDEHFKADIDKILDGKYSKVSSEYKDRILQFHQIPKSKYTDNVLWQILTKDSKRKKTLESKLGISIPNDLDLLDKPKPIDEIYLDKYKFVKEEVSWDINS